jgi:glycosyltransferase involved in cell wall biosynthesis
METDTPLPVTITLTRYREPDWLVMETLESLAGQAGVCGEVILLDQNWRDDFAERVEALSSHHLVFQCRHCPEKGLSHARNMGVEQAAYPVVLFIDPDAVAEPGWARELARAVSQPGVAIVGSRILPRWRGRKPILARARVVLDQYSLIDLGAGQVETHRVVGAGFGLNKTVCPKEMYFDRGLGRRQGKLFGGEESDLCARVLRAGGEVVYTGRSVVHHQILPERLNAAWVFRRLYYAGIGRAQGGGAPNPTQKPGFWDWLLLPLILPPYALGWIRARTQNRSLNISKSAA